MRQTGRFRRHNAFPQTCNGPHPRKPTMVLSDSAPTKEQKKEAQASFSCHIPKPLERHVIHAAGFGRECRTEVLFLILLRLLILLTLLPLLGISVVVSALLLILVTTLLTAALLLVLIATLLGLIELAVRGAIQPLNIVSHDFGHETILSRVLILPLAGLKLALDHHQTALSQIVGTELGRLPPSDNAMPLGALDALAGLPVAISLVRGNGKFGHGLTIGRVGQFGITPQPADDYYLVQASSHIYSLQIQILYETFEYQNFPAVSSRASSESSREYVNVSASLAFHAPNASSRRKRIFSRFSASGRRA